MARFRCVTLVTTFLLLLASFPLKSSAADDPEVFDQKSIIGEWRFKSGVKAGEELPADRLKADVSISADEIILTSAEGKFVIGYTFDSSMSPIKFTMTIKESPFGAGVSSKGLMELRDGDVVLGYNPRSEVADHPSQLISNAENGLYVFRLERRPQIQRENLLGSWTIESGKRAGKEVEMDRIAGSVEVARETITIENGAGKFVFEYKLDTTTTPAKLDMVVKESPFGAGHATKGRLDLADGKIILGYYPGENPKDYPPNLASTAENGLHVFHLKKK